MPDQDPHLQLPPAYVEDTRRRVSMVWIIPLVAALVAGWLAWKTLSEKGPTVTIAFSQAEGLEPGKTRVRYKDVDVGKVEDIQLSDDLTKVLVTASLSRSIGAHLNDTTRFWIVRPRVSGKTVSGLGTLISGVHVAIDPGQGEGRQREFVGLDAPPRIDSGAEGRRYQLQAASLGSLDVGSPVYFRQIQVGEVTRYELDPEGQSVRIGIFVKAPYDKLVREGSRFWNASGFDLQLGAQGVQAKFESLAALVLGGVAFDTPPNLEAGKPGAEGASFRLYPNSQSTTERIHTLKRHYVMYFDGTLRGLNAGAPVEFRGIRVGEVVDVDVRVDPDTFEVRMPVLVALYPDAFNAGGEASFDRLLGSLVSRGLRAQLKPGNLITGQLYIDLEVEKKAGRKIIVQREGLYPEFPTVRTELEQIARTAQDLLAKVDQMPLEEIARDLRDTVRGVKKLVEHPRTADSMDNLGATLEQVRQISGKLNQSVDPLSTQLRGTLTQLEATLASARGAVGEDSPLVYDLRRLMVELTNASRSFDALADYLQRHPEGLLRGKAKGAP